MNIQTLTDFFMWCSILNMGLMIFAFIFITLSGDFVYRMHTRWFPMSRETFNVVLYSTLGAYKLILFIFCITPWIALEIIA